MTLDECIDYAENQSEWMSKYAMIDIYKDKSEYYRQLAEWLKQLKTLKDFANYVAESVMEEDFKENSDFYAEVFCRKLHKMGFIEAEDDKWVLNNEEVNADDK